MFIDILKRQLEEKRSVIQVKDQISGALYADMNITSLDGSPITLGTPLDNLKIRFQTLCSGAEGFTPYPYRLDNHSNKSLHQHYEGFENPLTFPTISGALLHILGMNYYKLEEK